MIISFQDGFGVAKKKKLPFLVVCQNIQSTDESARQMREAKEAAHNLRCTKRITLMRLETLAGKAQLRSMVREKIANQKADVRECSDTQKQMRAALEMAKQKSAHVEEQVRQFEAGFAIAMHHLESKKEADAVVKKAKAGLEEAQEAHDTATSALEFASLKRKDHEWTELCHDAVVTEAVEEERERVLIVQRTLSRMRKQRRLWDGVDGVDNENWSKANPAHRMEKKSEGLLQSELVCEAEEVDTSTLVAATKAAIDIDIARENIAMTNKKFKDGVGKLL